MKTLTTTLEEILSVKCTVKAPCGCHFGEVLHMNGCECEKVNLILKAISSYTKKVIGDDKPKNPEYSILNPFRRMEEDARENTNREKSAQRKRANKWLLTNQGLLKV